MAYPHDAEDAVDHSWVQAVVSRARADLEEASAVLHESSPAAVAVADRTRVRASRASLAGHGAAGSSVWPSHRPGSVWNVGRAGASHLGMAGVHDPT